MNPIVRWRGVALVAFAAGMLPPVAAVYWARARAGRSLAERDATAVAAYLALVTPNARQSADYSLPQLLIRAHALDGLPGMAGRFEVYHATAPLVRATAPPLSAAILDRLRRGVAVRWSDEAHAALAPLLDRNGWDVVGAVAARVDGDDALFPPWLLAALLLLLVAAVQALRAMGGPPGAGVERQALRQYAAAAALFGIAAFAAVRLAAAGATDRWLDDVRRLMQEAAARVPDARAAPAELAGVARLAEIVPADSGSASPRRRDVAGAVRATVAVRLGPGRWVELRARPGEDGTLVWLPILLGVASLGPLGVWLGVWGNRAAPHRQRETIAAWAFLAPSLLHLAAFTIVPLFVVPYLSVHRWSPAEPMHPFVGLGNYARVLGDAAMWSALGHTLLYACSVPVSLALALGIALLLARHRGAWLLPALLLPYVASVVVIGLVWQRLYHPDVASLDGLLARLGLAPLNWLGDPETALVALLIVGVWMQLGYHVALFRAGLRNIPQAYLDAALLDGAGAWQRFRRVTMPLLRPVALVASVTGFVSALQVFTLVVVLTGGGPRQATDVMAYHIYRTAWERLQFGQASAEAMWLFALLVAAAWTLVRLLDRQVEHA